MHLQQWHKNLIALWISGALMMMGYYFFLPFFPLYVKELGVTDFGSIAQWAGIVTSTAAISMVAAQPVIGHLSDRYSAKVVIVVCKIATAIIIVSMGFVTSPEQLAGVRLLQGLVMGTGPASSVIIAASAPSNRLGFAMGILQTASFLGTSLGPFAGGWLSDTIGFRAAFVTAGVLLLLSGLIIVFVVREAPRPAKAKDEPRRSILRESREVLGTAIVPTVIAIMFLIQFGAVIVAPLISLFVQELQGEQNAATISGLVLGATSLASAVAAVGISRLGDKIGHNVILPICAIGSALLYIPQAFAQDVWQLLVLRVLLGLFLGGMSPSASVLLVKMTPISKRGAAFGLSGMAFALANVIGPLTGSTIAALLGLRAMFLATAGIFVVSFLLLVASLRRNRAVLKDDSPDSEPGPSPQSDLA